jgi:hypothetical protein
MQRSGRPSIISKIVLTCFAAASLIIVSVVPVSAQNAPAGPQSAAASSNESAQTTSSGAAQIGGKPNLAGTWTLNKDQSDNPQQKMQEAGGYGGRSMGGGMGMGRRNRGGGGMMSQLSQLSIVQNDSSVKVTNEGGPVLAAYSSSNSRDAANGGRSNGGDSNGGEDRGARTAAQWQGNDLVVQTQGRRDGTTTRAFELSPDGKQLYMITKIDNPRFQQPVTIRLVYDPAKTR